MGRSFIDKGAILNPDFRDTYQVLKQKLQEITDINGAASALIWDQSTYMPPGGAAARGRQLATLRRISHQLFTDINMGKLLDELEPMVEGSPADSDELGVIRLTRRRYEDAICVPPSFAAALAEHTAHAYAVWIKARPANDFGLVKPILEKTLAYSQQYSGFFKGYEHPADPLINQSDFGMTVDAIRPIFSELRSRTIPLVNMIGAQEQVDSSCLYQHFPEEEQWAFGMSVAKQFGYDIDRGRQDKTAHPFAIKLSLGDVRITTRFQDNRLDDGLFSTMHETGHALYEQGVSPKYEGTFLNRGTSAGVHESQSRLWENIVGRSLPFWQNYYPQLQATFPEQLSHIPLDVFYKAINRVEPSLIRTDADEVTYNLHVIIRFELELDLLEGKLQVADLPEAWHERYKSDLGVQAPNDSDGVLQDVHWYAGLIGGSFQGYSLGNILASQFYDKALEDHPSIASEIGSGKFDVLHNWLRDNIYQYGSKYTAPELIKRVTGGGLTLEPYFDYLDAKYGDIYKVERD